MKMVKSVVPLIVIMFAIIMVMMKIAMTLFAMIMMYTLFFLQGLDMIISKFGWVFCQPNISISLQIFSVKDFMQIPWSGIWIKAPV